MLEKRNAKIEAGMARLYENAFAVMKKDASEFSSLVNAAEDFLEMKDYKKSLEACEKIKNHIIKKVSAFKEEDRRLFFLYITDNISYGAKRAIAEELKRKSYLFEEK